MGDKLIIKQVNKKYDTEEELKNVLMYIVREKHSEEEGRVFCWKAFGASRRDITTAVGQFIKVQKIAGKDSQKRIRQFLISLPKYVGNVEETLIVADVVAAYLFKDYQVIYAVHEKEKRFHIHFAVNPVSYRTHKKWHMSWQEFAKWKTDVLDIINESRSDNGYSILEL